MIMEKFTLGIGRMMKNVDLENMFGLKDHLKVSGKKIK